MANKELLGRLLKTKACYHACYHLPWALSSHKKAKFLCIHFKSMICLKGHAFFMPHVVVEKSTCGYDKTFTESVEVYLKWAKKNKSLWAAVCNRCKLIRARMGTFNVSTQHPMFSHLLCILYYVYKLTLKCHCMLLPTYKKNIDLPTHEKSSAQCQKKNVQTLDSCFGLLALISRVQHSFSL